VHGSVACFRILMGAVVKDARIIMKSFG
jgi:hypothetical protein